MAEETRTSIRDDIAAAMTELAPSDGVQASAEIGSSPAVPSPQPQADAPSAEPSPASQGESDGKARGPDGKFIKTESAPALAAPVTTESPVDQASAEASTQGVKTPAWKAEMKVEFLKLPEHVQKYILERESEKDRTIGSRGPELDRLQKQTAEFEQVIAPYKDRIALSGSTPMQTVNKLLAAEDALLRNAPQAIAYLAREYGVDLRQFSQQQAPQPQLPPEIAPLYQEVGALRQHLQQQQQAQMMQIQEQINNDLTSFASTAEHMSDVENDMVPLVADIRARNPAMPNREVLQQAYERACWANPHVRQLMQAQANAAAEQQRRAQAEAAAKEAKRKAVGITGTPSGMPAVAGDDSLRGDILRAVKAQRA